MMELLLRSTNCRFLIAAVACALLCAGCGKGEPPTGAITGSLAIGGKPFGDCKVCIRSSATSSNRAARVGEDGSFEMISVPPGDYTVIIAPIPPIEDPMDPTPRSRTEADIFKRINPKFQRFAKSDLEVSVKADQTSELNIDLKK